MKISLCTVCMNRLEHLKQTLEKNIVDNENYPETEFILLDYNSQDGLELYVKNELSRYIEANKLIYCKTNTPAYFNRSHSRNLAFKVATGDVICNVDADNFTGSGFAQYLNEIFTENKGRFYYANERFDVIGRIAVMRSDFYKIGGFDERMVYYGFEDSDFMHRLLKSGLSAGLIREKKFLSALSHSNKDRMANEFVVNNYYKIFLCYLSPALSVLTLIFKDNTFYEGTIVNRLNLNTDSPDLIPNPNQYDYGITEENWVDGKWETDEDSFTFLYKNETRKIIVKQYPENSFKQEGTSFTYFEITEKSLVEEVIFFYSQLTNRIVFENNLKNSDYRVNEGSFGNDLIYKNFNKVAINV